MCQFLCYYDCFCFCYFYILFFFFKQKTAYEMRISDWSSDVCSSDLLTLEIGDDRVHVARDWPSDQYEEADRLIDRIVASGVCAIVVHDGHGKPPRRVTTGE